VNFASGLGGFFVKGHTVESRVVSGEQNPGVKPKLRCKVPKAGVATIIVMFAVMFAVMLSYERNRSR
jgi:hypothetical protein